MIQLSGFNPRNRSGGYYSNDEEGDVFRCGLVLSERGGG